MLKLKTIFPTVLIAVAILLSCSFALAQAPVPILDSINPASATQGTTLNILVSGSWFTPTSTVNFSGSGVIVQSVRYVSPTSLVATVVFSARAGDYTVAVSDGTARSNAASFSLLPGKVTEASELEVTAVSKMAPGSHFYDPSQMWVSAGYAFVTDATDGVVKKVSLSDGSVTTLAGNDGGFGSVDGFGAGARFGQPAGVWSDGSNVYVTDAYFDSIRRISVSTGYVSTLAGSALSPSGSADGVGSAARFHSPNGIWGDGANLYVCDTLNFTLRKIQISTGEVTTIAGQPQVRGTADGIGAAASFYAPIDVWGDGMFLYVADGSAIRKVSLATGEVRTLAGSPTTPDYADGAALQARFNFIAGIWGDGVNLFVADSGNDVVRKVSLESGAVTTLAGLATFDANANGLGREARFDSPTDIAGDGNAIFIVDRMNSDIKQGTAPSGAVTAPAPGTNPVPTPGTTPSVSSLISQLSFQLPAQGGISQTLSGESSTVHSGYGRLLPVSGSSSPSGFAIFSNRQGGVLISEATVPATEPMYGGRIPAQIDGVVNTGIAIANPNAEPATLTFFFTDSMGQTMYSGSTTIPGGATIASFLDQNPFVPASQLRIDLSAARTFTFFSSAPIGVTALRGFTNERSEFLMTTLPVAHFGATDSALVFAHYANGGGWKTQMVLVNPTDSILTGVADFFNDSSTAAGGAHQSIPYGIAPRSAVTLQLPDSSETRTGWIQVNPSEGSLGPSGLLIFSFQANGTTITQAGIPGAAPGKAFRVYAEASGDFTNHEPGSIESGFALTNSGNTPASVTWELFGLDGVTTGLRSTATVPAQGHIAVFLNELPSFQELQMPFKGFLRISDSPYATWPSIEAVGIRGRYNERGEFLITATTPTSESAAPASAAQLIFPYFVDGGGYTTQFVLFNGLSGQPSAGSLNFVGPQGSPLSVQVQE